PRPRRSAARPPAARWTTRRAGRRRRASRGERGRALQEAHALQEDRPGELEVGHDTARGDERARLRQGQPRLEVIVARPPGELERELADQLVQMPEIGDDALVLDRVADVRDEQDPDILQVVAVTTAV